MGIDFLVPAFAAGLLAAAVPVVIHLIHRRQSRLLPIATLRFLRKIPARTIRRRRLEEYVLLAARILLLLLLALAGMRPVLRDAAASGGSTCVAIVLDDSYSMEHRVAGVTRHQEAVQAALTVLRGLEEGDRAAVLPASAPGAALLTADLPGLARQTGASRTGVLAPDLLPATQAALALLREAKEPNRELVIVTDLQARAVDPLGTGLRREAADQEIRVIVVDVGAESPENSGIVRVRAGSGAVVAGETVPVTVEVRRSGTTGAETRLFLSVGDERVAETMVRLEPGQTVSVTIEAAADLPGAEAGRVQLEGDDLLADDVRHFALPVAGRIPTLLVNGDPSPLPYQDEAFFLRAALSPEDLGGLRSVTGPVALKVVEADAFGREDLGIYRVVILANVPGLPPREAAALRSFVLGGGGLLLFVGNRVRADDWNRDFGTDPDLGLLPAVLSAPAQIGDDPQAVSRLSAPDLGHPLFAGLPPEALRDLDRIHVRRALGADPKPARGRVIAGLERGSPLLVEKTVGRGRVLLVNTSADTDWGNLPVPPLFLPLLHRAVRLLASAPEEERDVVLGDRVAVPPPAASAPPPEVTDPLGNVSRPVRTEGAAAAEYGPVLVPGVYRVKGSGSGDYLFAANPDPREGDLARADPEALRAAFPGAPFRTVRSGENLSTEIRHSRRGRPVWGILLGAALLLLLFEAFFANRVAVNRAARSDREAAA